MAADTFVLCSAFAQVLVLEIKVFDIIFVGLNILEHIPLFFIIYFISTLFSALLLIFEGS